MINITIKHNFGDVREMLQSKFEDVAAKAISRSLNKVAAQVKTAAAKQMRAAGYKSFPAAVIKDRITIDKATQKRLFVTVRCNGKPLPLILFGARQTPDGVSVSVKYGRKVIKGAFIATMSNGHKGVFVRVGKQHKINAKGVWSGLPIKELFGPSVPSQFGNPDVQASLIDLVKLKYPAIFAHELKFASK